MRLEKLQDQLKHCLERERDLQKQFKVCELLLAASLMWQSPCSFDGGIHERKTLKRLPCSDGIELDNESSSAHSM